MQSKSLCGVLLMMAAACGGRAHPAESEAREIDCSSAAVGRSDNGATVVLLGESEVMVRHGGLAKVLPRPSCLQSIDRWHIAPDGSVIGATTHSGGAVGDVFGHQRGPTVTCFVDVASGRQLAGEDFKASSVTWFDGRSLELPKLFDEEPTVWLEGVPLQVPQAARPGQERVCEAATIGNGLQTEALVLCEPSEGGRRLVLRRFADRSWTPVGEDVVLPIGGAGFLADGKHVISPDGKQLALWDESWVQVVDLATRRRALMLEDKQMRIRAVQLDPAGQGRVMVLSIAPTGELGEGDEVTSMWVYDAAGAIVAEARWWGYPDVVWTEKDAYWKTNGCSAERLALEPR